MKPMSLQWGFGSKLSQMKVRFQKIKMTWEISGGTYGALWDQSKLIFYSKYESDQIDSALFLAPKIILYFMSEFHCDCNRHSI